jgi:subtilisin family serine protease
MFIVSLAVITTSSLASFSGVNESLYSFFALDIHGNAIIYKGDFYKLNSFDFSNINIKSFSKVNKVHLSTPVTQGNQDPDFNKQWALTTLDFKNLYDSNARGKGVTIAVVDTGVDSKHPDFDGRILKGYDIYSSTGDGSNDNNGHGTHVAGIIAAGVNGIGVEGLAPESSILPVKVLDSTGYGDDADVGRGVVWAVDNGADIISMSLGGFDTNQVLADSITYARSKGVVVVVAAGNSGSASSIVYPAADDGALAVGATGGDNKAVFFSSQGPWVDISAPGISILSTWPGGSYKNESGTSMATPYVSAAIADLISTGKFTPTQAEDRILATCTDVPLNSNLNGKDYATGCGLVDPYWAIDHTGPRTLESRTQLSPDQIPSIITVPTIDLPKLVAPVLPPMPIPSLPKYTIPQTVLPKFPDQGPTYKVSVTPIKSEKKASKTHDPIKKRTTPTYNYYDSLGNTIINIYLNKQPLINTSIKVYSLGKVFNLKTNFFGRIVYNGKIKVDRIEI